MNIQNKWLKLIYLPLFLIIIGFLFVDWGKTNSCDIATPPSVFSIVHQTSSLIAVMASFIITVLGFVAPFVLSLWSSMSDSFYNLFLSIKENEHLDEEAVYNICEEILIRLCCLRNNQNLAREMFKLIIVMSFVGVIAILVLSFGLPIWEINEYQAIRVTFFAFYLIFPIPIIIIIYLLIKERPDAFKRDIQVKILEKIQGKDCDDILPAKVKKRFFRLNISMPRLDVKMWKKVSFFVVSVLIICSIWETISRLGIYNAVLFPPPSVVFKALFETIRSGELITDLSASLVRAGVGFVGGAIGGIIFGFLTGCNKRLALILEPIANLFRSLPPIAIIPLVILLLGIGEIAKYFIIFWGVFFPIWLNTYVGVTKINEKYIWAAKSLGASTPSIFYHVIFPACSPFMVAGARIGISTALICLVAAEMAAASEGLGFRITYSQLIFRPDKVIAYLVVLAVLGALLDFLFVCIRNGLMRWYKPD